MPVMHLKPYTRNSSTHNHNTIEIFIHSKMAQQLTSLFSPLQPLLVNIHIYTCTNHTNYDMGNTWATKENTQFSSPPTTCAHYTKMTYASTFSPYTQTPPLITWEQPYTTKQHDKYTSYSSTRVTLLMTIDIHLGNPLQNTIPTWLYSCLCIR